MKKLISLTESDLHRIVENAIAKVIKTFSINENKNDALKKSYITEIYNGKDGGAYNGKRYLSESIKVNPDKCLYSTFVNEGIQFEPDENEKGGIIVFSTDVNAIAQLNNRFINWIKQKMATISNRLNATKKIDKIASENNLVGWTVGHYLDGRYTAKNGKQYGENSLSVEIIGIDLKTLMKIGEELCKSFKQESVLVKDFSSGRVMFVDLS